MITLITAHYAEKAKRQLQFPPSKPITQNLGKMADLFLTEIIRLECSPVAFSTLRNDCRGKQTFITHLEERWAILISVAIVIGAGISFITMRLF